MQYCDSGCLVDGGGGGRLSLGFLLSVLCCPFNKYNFIPYSYPLQLSSCSFGYCLPNLPITVLVPFSSPSWLPATPLTPHPLHTSLWHRKCVPFLTARIREDWMTYRGPGFLTIVWFGSFLLPSILSHHQVVSLLSLPVCRARRAYWEGGGGG